MKQPEITRHRVILSIYFSDAIKEANSVRFFARENPCLKTIPREVERSFEDPNPPFLSLIDSDPAEAERQLRVLLYYLIHGKYCRYFLKHIPNQFDDFATRFPEYCCGSRGKRAAKTCRVDPKCKDKCERKFCVLRQYENRGRPLAGYLLVVASSKIIDWYFRRNREDLQDDLSETGPSSARTSTPEDLISPTVEQCMSAGSNREQACGHRDCKLLLKLRFLDEKPPREIVVMLSEYRENNCTADQVSQHIRVCKEAMVECLKGSGFREEEYFGRVTKSGR